MKVNLLHAHGSPTGYLYRWHGCRCAPCVAGAADSRNAFRNAHRDEIRECDRRYREAHRDELAEYQRGYRRANPDRRRADKHRRRAEGTYPCSYERVQYARQGGKCFWGRKINPECAVSLKGGYEVDHVTPVALHGTNYQENIVLACPSCNRHKAARHPMDFAGVMF